MYKKSKTFHPVNMFRELHVLESPALFKTFVYFEKKGIFITSLFGTGYILLILFIAQVLIKQIKNKIYVSKHEAWIAQNHIAFFHFDKMQISVT